MLSRRRLPFPTPLPAPTGGKCYRSMVRRLKARPCVLVLNQLGRVRLCVMPRAAAARLLCPWGSPARALEGAAMPTSRGPSPPRDRPQAPYVSCMGRWVLYHQRHLGRQVHWCSCVPVNLPKVTLGSVADPECNPKSLNPDPELLALLQGADIKTIGYILIKPN